jgi:signal transduction histidine kinase
MANKTPFFGLRHLPHAPPFRPRFWIYCVAAYLMPIVVQIVLPDDPGSTDELVWLATLAPAFLLSLHYGLRGALLGLLGGTLLFVVVQTIIALRFTPDDWRITVPIYVAYGTLAVTVGWLSEELHGYYNRALSSERMAAIGQFAVTVRHEINNALTAIVAESQFLLAGSDLTESQKASAHNIYESARRIARNVEKMTNLADAPVTTYVGQVQMVDLERAQTRKR